VRGEEKRKMCLIKKKKKKKKGKYEKGGKDGGKGRKDPYHREKHESYGQEQDKKKGTIGREDIMPGGD